MEIKIKNKIVLLLGCNGAIGKELTQTLVQEHCIVILQYRKESTFVKELKKCYYTNLFFINYDFEGNYNDFLVFHQKITDIIRFKIDVIINCVGITDNKLLNDSSPDAWSKVIHTNTLIPYYICRYLKDILNDNASIILLGSFYGIEGRNNQTAYSTSKSSLIGFVKSLSKEYEGRIKINLLLPGFIPSNLNINYPEKTIEAMNRSTLNLEKNLISLTTFIVFLISSYSNINGQIFSIDSRVQSSYIN